MQTVLITGASTGIGYHAAVTLKAAGYRVFATARKPLDVTRLIEHGFESVQLDLSSTASITAAVTHIIQLTDGKIDVLFNNGAYGQPGAVEDLPTDALRAQFEANVFGWHELTTQIIPLMRANGRGRIIQNSSVLGLVTMKYRGAYNASKFALEGLTDTLRLELLDSPIKVSLIEPGPIVSQFRANALLAFQANIDIENSIHSDDYQQQISRLGKKDVSNRFTLGPEAVTKALIHAIESKNPKVRYYVTFPTYLFALLKRILPFRVLDKILAKSG
ncbi:SDR family oxidoreductase [Moritella sp.]|uniref:SDR family oxidoreductase n=1 Tax=Moritella sp. TaxID=78556 RepID=UPI001DA65201|nr:SDR family oxidoreductase [Moritella sp.]MCJ8348261.1 SDR family oxidoreductase [Moritella sp.]NQZ40646.1 SDR family oxidoreductase [Moritella sp.]